MQAVHRTPEIVATPAAAGALVALLLFGGCRSDGTMVRSAVRPESRDDHVVTLDTGMHVGDLSWNRRSTKLVGVGWYQEGHQRVSVGRRLLVMTCSGRSEFVSVRHSDSSPAWSPDGRRIVFARQRGALTTEQSRLLKEPSGSTSHEEIMPVLEQSLVSDLYVMSATGADVEQLTQGKATQTFSNPRWSPDGKSIGAIAINFGSRTKGIWLGPSVCGSNGASFLPVPDPESAVGIYSLTWCSNGRRIAVIVSRVSVRPIQVKRVMYVIDIDSEQWNKVAENSNLVWGQELLWVRDSEDIVFAARDNAGLSFQAVNMNTGETREVLRANSPAGYDFYEYSWRPAGNAVAIIGYRDDENGAAADALFVEELHNHQLARLFSGGRISDVTWSPNGAVIAFVENGNRVHFISVEAR